jgi:lipopolysaccharide export system protein LptC
LTGRADGDCLKKTPLAWLIRAFTLQYPQFPEPVLNDPRYPDAKAQAQREASLRDQALREQALREQVLRDQALARAQARLDSEARTAEAGNQDVRPLSHPPGYADFSPQAPAVQPVAVPSQIVAPVAGHPLNNQQQGKLQAGGLDFIGGERDARDFLRANRHSGKVRFLRVALPLAGVFILFVVVGAYWWSLPSTPSVSMQSAGIENGKMVMKNPELNGVDQQQRPYTLVAREAIQDPAAPNEVELNNIDARVPMEDGLFAKILAGKGYYDSKAKTLKLDQDVDIKTDDGMKMTLKDADIDMEAGNLQTANPVSIVTEQAVISADSFTVEKNGEKVVFENRVRMTLYPDKIQGAQKPGEAAGSPASQDNQ